MSADVKTPVASKEKRSKHRDSHHASKKSLKKRRREDGEESSQRTEGSPVKKHKKRQDQGEDHIIDHSSKKHKKSKQKESQKSSQRAQPVSPFALQTTSMYLPLSPISQHAPTAGLCAEHLSPLILTYVPALEGIMLSYSNARISNAAPSGVSAAAIEHAATYGKSIAEYAYSFAWLTADFVVLRPIQGAEMEGYINSQDESRLGLLCWNLFNASIERKRLPKDWRWEGPNTRRKNAKPQDANEEVEDDQNDEEQADEEEEEPVGGFLDSEDQPVIGRQIKFKIIDWEIDQSGRAVDASASTSSLVSFEGTMLSEEDEAGLLRAAKIKEADRLAERRRARERAVRESQRGSQRDSEAEQAEDG